MAQRLVEMRGITKRYGRHAALDGVSFDVEPGEVHVLAGENGAGKTTLIKVLSGVVACDEGRIRVRGEAVRPRTPLEAAALGIAVIHQELSLVPSMSVADNMFLGRPRTMPGGFVATRRQRREAAGALARLGLDLDLDAPVARLALAEQQMVEIARALLFDARVFIMDEPTSALPKSAVERVFSLMDQLRREGCGVVFISHKMEEIERVADRITVLRDGRHVGTAPAAELPVPELIRWMVGRELESQIPYEPATRGEERLRVEGLEIRGVRGRPGPVRGVSLDVRAGEVLGLAGLEGSGTSALLLGLFGAHGRQTRGAIHVDGRRERIASPREAMRRGIALLTSDRKTTGLVLGLSVIDNLVLADLERLSPWGWRRPRRERETGRRHAEAMNLRAPGLHMEVGVLSGGNQQKVALAKWLQCDPWILLLDEPTRGVDVGAKREIYGLINRLKQQGVAIVLISTELPELLGLSDRVVVMHRGRITARLDRDEATPDRVLEAAMGGSVRKEVAA